MGYLIPHSPCDACMLLWKDTHRTEGSSYWLQMQHNKLHSYCVWLIIYVCYPADHCLPPRACDSSPTNWTASSLRYDFRTADVVLSHTHKHTSLPYSVRLLTITHHHWCALQAWVCCIYFWQECTGSIFKFASCSQWPRAHSQHPTDAPNQPMIYFLWTWFGFAQSAANH